MYDLFQYLTGHIDMFWAYIESTLKANFQQILNVFYDLLKI